MAISLSSPSFTDQSAIPTHYTCDGADESPPLRWRNVPEAARSLALVVDDPDAGEAPFVHWILYNLPPGSSSLPAGVTDLPDGAAQGSNGWGRTGYGGPCPPHGMHRYVHTLYALDTVLPDLGTPDAEKLRAAMEGHIVATSILTGRYQRTQ